MNFYVGNTDFDWYSFLKAKNNPLAPEDINFWKPGANSTFKAISKNEPFLLRLKSPRNVIAGVAFFSSFVNLPINYAWEVFGEANGTDSFSKFKSKIESYRFSSDPSLANNPNIGCIVLSNPIFFDESLWIESPSDWSRSIVQGKTYSDTSEIGKRLWQKVVSAIQLSQPQQPLLISSENSNGYYLGTQKIRIGQGAFRVNVTESYSRRCAISGERTLPVLQAAHIKSYADDGPNITSNGILLRSDLHTLYDAGYLAITEDYHVEISPRLHEEFSNGKDYYKYHGEKLLILPNDPTELPSKEFLRWHNETYFR